MHIKTLAFVSLTYLGAPRSVFFDGDLEEEPELKFHGSRIVWPRCETVRCKEGSRKNMGRFAKKTNDKMMIITTIIIIIIVIIIIIKIIIIIVNYLKWSTIQLK